MFSILEVAGLVYINNNIPKTEPMNAEQIKKSAIIAINIMITLSMFFVFCIYFMYFA